MIGQAAAITAASLRAIPGRLGPSLVAIVGVAGVVAVLVAVLSMARGFEKSLEGGASPENVVVMRSGAGSELESGLEGEQVRLIAQAPQLRLVSPEVYVIIDLTKATTGTSANVPLRGVAPEAVEIRSDLELVEGRMFEPGRRELIVGEGAAGQFVGLEVGNTLEFGTERWAVVGRFVGGGPASSELWTDSAVLQGAYRRGNNFSSVYGRLVDAGAFGDFKDALTADPRLSLSVQRETDYLAEQSQALSTFIRVAGYGIAALMALGALFGALNTMYNVVAQRAREIGTLRALGFSPGAVVVSVLVEAMLLALLGGLLGAALAWLLFNGVTVSTLNFASFTQVVFDFAITPELLVQGLLLALVIGLVGGLGPALRAARMPIVAALRE
ncbi:ABC transporter permease [Wenzhouxiangella sp. XN79A]|uniref:ABC transporter permease n=1 Tax=Wenzhouxiangella sp. XN79A TaxID=2724193 RepID=UPI00144AA925|nr:ABC transporter permease [Wenzhouxiangella sp. XN79A]NKI36211.1 ABC transporter permease [Wenzhouxiangella sp. XN79A]